MNQQLPPLPPCPHCGGGRVRGQTTVYPGRSLEFFSTRGGKAIAIMAPIACTLCGFIEWYLDPRELPKALEKDPRAFS
jgi:hypothetical protein